MYFVFNGICFEFGWGDTFYGGTSSFPYVGAGMGIPATAAKVGQGVRGNGIGGQRRRKIGRIGCPTVGRGPGIRKNVHTDSCKRNFMNFTAELVKIVEIYRG